MKTIAVSVGALILATASGPVRAGVVYQADSAYHHIQVVDRGGMRILSFNGSQETRMSLRNPLQGHFEYTEFFHLAWLWNASLERVLMVGLGGGSTQRSFQSYYPQVTVDTIEIDPVVVRVARDYFGVTETPKHRIQVQDGRMFLRRSQEIYDAIFLDAYATTRYGSSMPYHLTTQEFHTLAKQRLSTNGVFAVNVIGNASGWRANIVGALYRTLNTVFPQVYLFAARESQNVVLIATVSADRLDRGRLNLRAGDLLRAGKIRLPTFAARLASLQQVDPAAAVSCPILTDDHAPLDRLWGVHHQKPGASAASSPSDR